jgi:UDP-N-acetylglucosamine 2-epimerase (non-hydrolysing)
MLDSLGQHAPRTLECFRRSDDEMTTDVEFALARMRPSVAIIAGDSDVAVAAAFAAARDGIPIARVGAGLRCGDRSLPAEINRIVVDAMADHLYVDADEQVRALGDEGVPGAQIRRVGSTLPDVVYRWIEHAQARAFWRRLGVNPGQYALVALHSPENLRRERVDPVVNALCRLAARMPVVMCLDPAARRALETTGHLQRLVDVGTSLLGPLSYVDFLSLQTTAGAVVTDSTNVQEETSILGVRCFTLRRSTEATLTLVHGTNLLLGDDVEQLEHVTLGAVRGDAKFQMSGWDGAAGRRIAADLRVVTMA